jgi:hypothetical protein
MPDKLIVDQDEFVYEAMKVIKPDGAPPPARNGETMLRMIKLQVESMIDSTWDETLAAFRQAMDDEETKSFRISIGVNLSRDSGMLATATKLSFGVKKAYESARVPICDHPELF